MSGTKQIDIISICEQKLRKILIEFSTTPLSTDFTNFRKSVLQQFTQRVENDSDDCTLESFALYFVNTVRRQTYCHLRTIENVENQLQNKDETQAQKKPVRDEVGLEVRPTLGLRQFPSLGTPRNTSTPTRKSLNQNQLQQQQQQQHHQSHKQDAQNRRRSTESGNRSFGATANNSSFEKNRSSTNEGKSGSNSFCLGDFLTSPTVNNRHLNVQKKKVNTSTTSPSTPNSNTNNSKPKKRVTPLRLGKNSASAIQDSGPFNANSSFSQENNLLTPSQTEVKDFSHDSIAEDRKALKNDLLEISSAIKASTESSALTTKRQSVSDVAQSVQTLNIDCSLLSNIEGESFSEQIDFEKISNQTSVQLKTLANIYALLLDMNLTTNILFEISFLLNLLNANTTKTKSPTESDCTIQSVSTLQQLLNEPINSIYFAISVLEEQQHTLALIDVKSLGVILQCERLVTLSHTLKSCLSAVYTQKQMISNVALQDISLGGLRNVCFQEESDSRKFFYNNNEFAAFKKQRDLFYSVLKLWEKHHLYPSWNFTKEASPKIHEIFRQSENSVNMTHFAKLFVSQLIVSSTERTSPEEVGIETDDIDIEKFNKLSQRLVAPGEFSVDYQFPREQAFFRDFITESCSIPFIEHLKIVLFSELATLNESHIEHVDLLVECGYNESNEESEFIVRPSVLSSMLILAKFLGFVIALPFQGSSSNETTFAMIQNHQLHLRKLLQPPINICHLLDAAITNGRYLITLPWVVQYLAMLDEVTLLLDSFVQAIHKLYDFYTSLGTGELQILPTSAFIIRCCLGWLFEQKPSIGAEYLNYRNSHNSNIKLCLKPHDELVKADRQVKPILDSILCVACPFLAEFRVSIMPAKHAMAKYVSRSGRFRHITPCNAEPSRINEKQTNRLHQSNTFPKSSAMPETTSTNSQKMLMESFLHSQNSSMQRLIVFLTERVYKCVVRDAQSKILLPSKAAADKQINEITASSKEIVLQQVEDIYQTARIETQKQWDNDIPKMVHCRTEYGLEALLPIETASIVKKAYAEHIRTAANMKIKQWQHTNLIQTDFYCNDIYELATKICRVNDDNTKKSANQTTELKLIKSQPRISELIDEMQHWLYTTGFETSFQPEHWSGDNTDVHVTASNQRDERFIEFLDRLKCSFENTLPTIYYRLIGAGLVQILQHFIVKTPMFMTDDLIQVACTFFSNDKISCADVPLSPTKENKTDKSTESTNSKGNDLNSSSIEPTAASIYHTLITAPFIESLGSCHLRYDKLKKLLCSLIDYGVITLDFVNDRFLSVFKEDLNSDVLNAVSEMLNELAQKSTTLSKAENKTSNNDSDDSDNDLKSKLFMEMLADLSRNLDEF